MTIHGVRFEGPASLALPIATALADADGVELISSESSSALENHRVQLDVEVQGTLAAVTNAVEEIRGGLADGASLEFNDR